MSAARLPLRPIEIEERRAVAYQAIRREMWRQIGRAHGAIGAEKRDFGHVRAIPYAEVKEKLLAR